MLSSFSIFFTFIIYFLISCQAQLPSQRPCLPIKKAANYDPTKFLGRWYRYAALPTYPFGKCRQERWLDNNDGLLTINERQLSNTPDGFPVLDNTYKLKYDGNSGYREIYPTDSISFNQTLVIWSTDYTSYGIKGICINLNGSSLYFGWILTRELNPSPSVIAKINKAMKDERLRWEDFRFDNHTSCPLEF